MLSKSACIWCRALQYDPSSSEAAQKAADDPVPGGSTIFTFLLGIGRAAFGIRSYAAYIIASLQHGRAAVARVTPRVAVARTCPKRRTCMLKTMQHRNTCNAVMSVSWQHLPNAVYLHAAQALIRAARARALIQGRDFVTPDDVASVTLPALAHRLVPAWSANGGEATRTATEILEAILQRVEPPR